MSITLLCGCRLTLFLAGHPEVPYLPAGSLYPGYQQPPGSHADPGGMSAAYLPYPYAGMAMAPAPTCSYLPSSSSLVCSLPLLFGLPPHAAASASEPARVVIPRNMVAVLYPDDCAYYCDSGGAFVPTSSHSVARAVAEPEDVDAFEWALGG